MEVFLENLTLELNGATWALKYYGPCHTDSDLSVEFTSFDIPPHTTQSGADS